MMTAVNNLGLKYGRKEANMNTKVQVVAYERVSLKSWILLKQMSKCVAKLLRYLHKLSA